jgi:hypothetical protein
MSEPTAPPPQPSAQKKGLGPVAWILIGCLGLLLLAALGFGACTFFVGKKVKTMAEDFSENPARAAAEMAVKLNPELELVETDESAETITFRNKKTGEELTMDWSEIREGNFSLRSNEGEFKIDATGDGEGAVISMTGEDGESTQIFGGSASADVPEWVPLPDGAGAAQSAYSTNSGGKVSGTFIFQTEESVAEVLAFYVEALEEAGYETSQSNYSGGGRSGGGVNGTHRDTGRTVGVGVGETDDGTQVTVSYSHGG